MRDDLGWAMRRFGLGLLLLCLGLCIARAQEPHRLRLALAANLQPVFPALKGAFEQEMPGVKVEATFGATGSLQTQILNGTPFDLFLSADEAAPKALAEAGLALEDPFPYGQGVLVMWVPKDSPIPIEAQGFQALSAPLVRGIALADPKVAPEGAAAEAALKGAGLLDALRPKLVYT